MISRAVHDPSTLQVISTCLAEMDVAQLGEVVKRIVQLALIDDDGPDWVRELLHAAPVSISKSTSDSIKSLPFEQTHYPADQAIFLFRKAVIPGHMHRGHRLSCPYVLVFFHDSISFRKPRRVRPRVGIRNRSFQHPFRECR